MGAPWEEGKRLFALQTRFMAARGELNAPSAPQYIARPWKMDRLVETKQNHFHQLCALSQGTLVQMVLSMANLRSTKIWFDGIYFNTHGRAFKETLSLHLFEVEVHYTISYGSFYRHSYTRGLI